MISSNPYRYFGVLANDSIKLIQKNLSKIKAYNKINKQISFPQEFNSINLNKIERNESLTIDSNNKILQDFNRVHHALFWFVNFNPTDEIALSNLEKGDIKKAEDIWNKVIKQNSISTKNISAYNNLGTLLLCKSLSKNGIQFEKKFPTTAHGQSGFQILKNALKLKLDIIFSEDLKYFSKKIISNEFATNKDQCLTFFKDIIEKSLKNFSIKEVSQLINDLDERFVEIYNSSLISDPLYSINEKIETANNEVNEDNAKGSEIANKLMINTSDELKQLKEILGDESIQFQNISDKLANQIMQCGILCFNNNQEGAKDYMDIFEFSLIISFKEQTKDRAKRTIKTIEESINANICKFCNYSDVYKTPIKVQMHKFTGLSTYTYFKDGGYPLFACEQCKDDIIKNKNKNTMYALVIYLGLIGILGLIDYTNETGFFFVFLFFEVFVFIWGVVPGWIFRLIYKPFKKSYFEKISTHPEIISNKLQGYQFGMPKNS